jgi:hypothetical protein
MADLAFSNKEPWEVAEEAMNKLVPDLTDGAYKIKKESGAIQVFAEGPDTVPLGPDGYMKNPPSAYHKDAKLPVRFMGWRCIYYTVPHGYLEYLFKKVDVST